MADVTDELQCTISVSATIDVNLVEFEITVEVSGPCSEIQKNGKEIANDILKEVKKAIEDAF